MGIRPLTRAMAPALLVIHVLFRLALPAPQFLVDLILYNAIAICGAVAILASPNFNDRVSKVTLALAVLLWSAGSILSTSAEFYDLPQSATTIANACYLLLYPCAFVGLPRALRNKPKFGTVELLDSAILGLGLSSIGSALLIAPVVPHFAGNIVKTFFAVLFPVADLILVALTLTLAVIAPMSRRSALISFGIIFFAISDFLFLWLSVNNQYTLGSLSDDGWLLGIVILAEGFWNRGEEKISTESLHPLFIAASVMMSATLLAITALRPDYLPDFILAPTIATLCLAFIRMTIALRDARSIGEERILARADELTGLPNRRRFLAELSLLSKSSKTEDALLLLDLDGFKPINDQYGHEVGDMLLKQVSMRFERALPQGSLLARLGGDEFGVIVRGADEATFEAALALRATLSYPFSIAEHEITVGVSVGHVSNDGAPDLLLRADNAMYQAKREKLGVWSESFRN